MKPWQYSEIRQTKHASCLEKAEGADTRGEVVALKGALLEKISEVTAEFHASVVQPPAGAAMVLAADIDEVKEACSKFVATENTVSVKYSVHTEEDPAYRVGKVGIVTLFTRTKTNKPCSDDVAVNGQLVCIKSRKTFPVSVMRNGNKYTLTFAPVQRGIHKLQVSIDNQPLKELTMSVILLQESLKKPKSVITGLARPWGVAINSKGHLVVDNKDHWVCVFRKMGQ